MAANTALQRLNINDNVRQFGHAVSSSLWVAYDSQLPHKARQIVGSFCFQNVLAAMVFGTQLPVKVWLRISESVMSNAAFQRRASEADPARIFEHLAELPDQSSRLNLVSNLKLLTASTVEQLDEAVATLVRKDLNKAHVLADLALAMANQLGGTEPLAFASRAMANALWFLGQNSQAAEHNRRAIELFQQAGKQVEAGRTLSTSIQPLILLGEYDRAQ